MANTEIYFAKGDSPKMIDAFIKAQESFKYFWRELYWDHRRIVPALDIKCVKVAFTQKVDNSDEPIVEHMWINEIHFDGELIYGTLINDPNELTNVNKGDSIEIPLNQISDWLFSLQGKTYGGFTIHAMRSEMKDEERKEHDKAWRVDFGDFNDILIVYEQKKKPDNLIEHPMSINMKNSLVDFLKTNPGELTSKDEFGYTLLHRETIAGNKTSVEALMQAGVNLNETTNNGKTALDFARQLSWLHIIPLLEN